LNLDIIITEMTQIVSLQKYFIKRHIIKFTLYKFILIYIIFNILINFKINQSF